MFLWLVSKMWLLLPQVNREIVSTGIGYVTLPVTNADTVFLSQR